MAEITNFSEAPPKILFERGMELREISKQEGRAMNAKYPQYVYATCHRRHYWVEESKEGLAALAKVQEEMEMELAEKLVRQARREARRAQEG